MEPKQQAVVYDFFVKEFLLHNSGAAPHPGPQSVNSVNSSSSAAGGVVGEVHQLTPDSVAGEAM